MGAYRQSSGADLNETTRGRKLGSKGALTRGGPVGGFPKRLFDVLVAVVLLTVLAPIMLLVSLLVRSVLKGSAIAGQRSVGFNRAVFVRYKFRTFAGHPVTGCVGQVLRKSGIDQLPQLFNVLSGDMSLVGPQPIALEEIEHNGRHARAYLRARPGVTGLRRPTRRRGLNSERIVSDRYYVRHWSFRLDLTALVKTMRAAMRPE